MSATRCPGAIAKKVSISAGCRPASSSLSASGRPAALTIAFAASDAATAAGAEPMPELAAGAAVLTAAAAAVGVDAGTPAPLPHAQIHPRIAKKFGQPVSFMSAGTLPRSPRIHEPERTFRGRSSGGNIERVSSNEALIRFKSVKKAFGQKVIYSGLDLEIKAGESLTIIGGSGGGRSGMLKRLMGLLKVGWGSLRFHAQAITRSGLAELGPCPQRNGCAVRVSQVCA